MALVIRADACDVARLMIPARYMYVRNSEGQQRMRTRELVIGWSMLFACCYVVTHLSCFISCSSALVLVRARLVQGRAALSSLISSRRRSN